MRLYPPKADALTGKWNPPPVKKVQGLPGRNGPVNTGPERRRLTLAGDCEASRTLDGTASKKHQGTKSR